MKKLLIVLLSFTSLTSFALTESECLSKARKEVSQVTLPLFIEVQESYRYSSSDSRNILVGTESATAAAIDNALSHYCKSQADNR